MSEPIRNEAGLEEIAREAAEKFRDEYTFSKPCCVDGEPDAQTVWLKIGNQSFSLDGYHDPEHVAYFRLMLGKALATFASRVTENAEKEKSELREFIEQYFVKGVLRFPDGRSYRERAIELLNLSGGVESRNEPNERPTDQRASCSPALVNSGSRSNALPAQNFIAAAAALVERLRLIHYDPRYQAVWISYQNHGGDYSSGPTYTKELSHLERLLSDVGPKSDTGSFNPKPASALSTQKALPVEAA